MVNYKYWWKTKAVYFRFLDCWSNPLRLIHFLKAVFYKFHLAYSWILCPISYTHKTFWETKISYPLIGACMCAYLGVRNVIFLETFVYLLNGWAIALHKIYHNAGFQWPVFFRIRTESYIISLYGRIQVSENPYSRILYEVLYTKFIITPELNMAMIWIFYRKLNMVTIWQHQKKFAR